MTKSKDPLKKKDVLGAAVAAQHNTTPEETMRRVASKQKGRKPGLELKQLKIEYREIDELKPNAYNPNRQNEHEFKMLLDSMRDNGFTTPIVILKDGTIVDGEHRWRAATTLGIKKIPVVIAEIDEIKARVATLTHNRARGTEDIQLVAEMMRDFEKAGALAAVQDALGMSDLEVQRLLDDIPAPEALASEEFSESWAPDKSVQVPTDDSGRRVDDVGGGLVHDNSMTKEAADALRKRQESVRKAKTEEERRMIQEQGGTYRVAALFTEQEAEIVKAVLAPNPSERILELCVAELKRTKGKGAK